jgi:Domain of unknown function (DUF6542)
VVLALALATVGALFDALTSKTLGTAFEIGFVLGCLLAVLLVKRRSLFGPMVQPPLIMIVVAGPVLALFAGGSSGGLAAKAIAIGPPLISNFPAMAIATVATVVVGVIRLILQRKLKDELAEEDNEDFPPPARRTPPARDARDSREPVRDREREPGPRQPPPRQAPGRRPTPPPPGRDRMERPDRPDRERMDRQPPPPPRQAPPGRGGAPGGGGRPIPGGGGRPAAPGRGGGGMNGRPAGGGRPPQPPPRRPRRPDDDY